MEIDETKFRLYKIKEIENYFKSEIDQKNLCSEKLRNYTTVFEQIDKVLIVLSATSGEIWVISSISIVGASVGIAEASFTLVFSLITGIIKKLLSIKRNKKRKHDKIITLAKGKPNSIEALVSQALIKASITILKEKDKYEKMNENVKNLSEKLKEKQKNTRWNSVNSRKMCL